MKNFNLRPSHSDPTRLAARIRSDTKIREQLARLSRLNPAISGLAIAGDWLIILGCIFLSERVGGFEVYLASVLVIASRQHALLVLMHEGAHYRLHGSAVVNDLLSDLFAAFPLFADTAGYRGHHHAHHRHLNTSRDPDWMRKVGLEEWQFPKSSAAVAKELVLNFFRCPVEWAKLAWHFSFRSRWILKMASLTLAAAILTVVDGWQEFVIYWLVPLFLLFPWLQRFRSVAEHFGLKYNHELEASRNVYAPWYEAFFFGPHNVNHHLTHHLFPAVPFYRLGQTSRILREIEEFSTEAHQNSSYLLPLGRSVLRDLVHIDSPKLEGGQGSD